RRQLEQRVAAGDAAGDQIELQVCSLQTEDVRWPAAPKQRTNACKQLRQGKRLDQVIIGPEVKAHNPIVNAVTRRQDKDRSLDAPLPESLQDLQAAATRQHDVQDDEIEDLRIRTKEAVLAGRGHHDLVVVRLQGRFNDLREFALVFDDQDTH